MSITGVSSNSHLYSIFSTQATKQQSSEEDKVSALPFEFPENDVNTLTYEEEKAYYEAFLAKSEEMFKQNSSIATTENEAKMQEFHNEMKAIIDEENLLQEMEEKAQNGDALASDVLDKIKSGMSIKDALIEAKTERYEMYFEEELAKNGGNVREAAEKAKARLEAETEVTDEEYLGFIQGLSDKYEKLAQNGSDEIKEIAEDLEELAEELSKQIELTANSSSGKVESEKTGKQGPPPPPPPADSDSEEDEITLQQQFIDNLLAASEENSENLSSQAEQRRQTQGIRQYEKVAVSY